MVVEYALRDTSKPMYNRAPQSPLKREHEGINPEPIQKEAAQESQSHDHTKTWAKIASFDAYVLVTPEYNHVTSRVLQMRMPVD
jgi:hypothetical protein